MNNETSKGPSLITILEWPYSQCNGGGHGEKSAPRPLVTIAFKSVAYF